MSNLGPILMTKLWNELVIKTDRAEPRQTEKRRKKSNCVDGSKLKASAQMREKQKRQSKEKKLNVQTIAQDRGKRWAKTQNKFILGLKLYSLKRKD